MIGDDVISEAPIRATATAAPVPPPADSGTGVPGDGEPPELSDRELSVLESAPPDTASRDHDDAIDPTAPWVMSLICLAMAVVIVGAAVVWRRLGVAGTQISTADLRRGSASIKRVANLSRPSGGGGVKLIRLDHSFPWQLEAGLVGVSNTSTPVYGALEGTRSHLDSGAISGSPVGYSHLSLSGRGHGCECGMQGRMQAVYRDLDSASNRRQMLATDPEYSHLEVDHGKSGTGGTSTTSTPLHGSPSPKNTAPVCADDEACRLRDVRRRRWPLHCDIACAGHWVICRQRSAQPVWVRHRQGAPAVPERNMPLVASPAYGAMRSTKFYCPGNGCDMLPALDDCRALWLHPATVNRRRAEQLLGSVPASAAPIMLGTPHTCLVLPSSAIRYLVRPKPGVQQIYVLSYWVDGRCCHTVLVQLASAAGFKAAGHAELLMGTVVEILPASAVGRQWAPVPWLHRLRACGVALHSRPFGTSWALVGRWR